MEKILGLDMGEKRVGVAVSDGLKMLAHPLKTLPWKNEAQLLADLQEIIREENIVIVVVGLPITMKGHYSKRTEEVAKVIDYLRENLNIPVKEMDERLTTVMAEKALQSVGKKASKQRNKIDQIAATYILQAFLDGNYR